MSTMDLAFQGAQKVIGLQSFNYATQKKIMIVGLGGVGSWTVEALARSGFQKLILVDLDEVCVSNTNRQIHTLTSTVGQLKAEVLKARILDIHPECEVEVVADFMQKENISFYIEKYQPDLIVDAIDSLSVKCELVATCRDMNVPILVSGSAGGKLLASELKISDLSQSYEDDLLHQMRKRLRQKHRFPRGKRKFRVQCVFSAEPKMFCSIDANPENEKSSGRLDCRTGLGSLCHVTASMGMLLAQMTMQHFLSDFQNQSALLEEV